MLTRNTLRVLDIRSTAPRKSRRPKRFLAHFEYSVVITDLRLSKLGFGGLNLVKHIREVVEDSHHRGYWVWLA